MNPNFGKSDLYPNINPSLKPKKSGNSGNLIGPNNDIFRNVDPHNTGDNRKPPSIPEGARFDPFGPSTNIGKIDPNPDELKRPDFETFDEEKKKKKNLNDPFL
jgi:hypothetical protein